MAKSARLQEVEEAAVRITKNRIRAFKEEQELKKAQAEKEAAKVAAKAVVEEKESK